MLELHSTARASPLDRRFVFAPSCVELMLFLLVLCVEWSGYNSEKLIRISKTTSGTRVGGRLEVGHRFATKSLPFSSPKTDTHDRANIYILQAYHHRQPMPLNPITPGGRSLPLSSIFVWIYKHIGASNTSKNTPMSQCIMAKFVGMGVGAGWHRLHPAHKHAKSAHFCWCYTKTSKNVTSGVNSGAGRRGRALSFRQWLTQS